MHYTSFLKLDISLNDCDQYTGEEEELYLRQIVSSSVTFMIGQTISFPDFFLQTFNYNVGLAVERGKILFNMHVGHGGYYTTMFFTLLN